MKTSFAALTLGSFLAFHPSPAEAQITYEWFIRATDPSYLGGPVTGMGSFAYGEGVISGIGYEILTPNELWYLSVRVFGQSLSMDNDAHYPVSPTVTMLDGVPYALSFVVSERSGYPNPTEIDEPGVTDIILQGYFTPGEFGYWDIPMAIIPEPTTFTLLGLGSLALVMGRRRR